MKKTPGCSRLTVLGHKLAWSGLGWGYLGLDGSVDSCQCRLRDFDGVGLRSLRRLAIGFIMFIFISYRIHYCSYCSMKIYVDSWLRTFANLELASIDDQQSFWRHWHCWSRSCCWPVTLICSIWNPLSHSAVCLFLHATSADDILMVQNELGVSSALVDTGSLPRPNPTRRFKLCHYAPLSYFAEKLVILLHLVLYDGAAESIPPPFFATRLVSTACSSFLHANSRHHTIH